MAAAVMSALTAIGALELVKPMRLAPAGRITSMCRLWSSGRNKRRPLKAETWVQHQANYKCRS